MNSDSENPQSGLAWWWHVIFLAAIVGLLAAIAIPNYIGGGSSKLTSIINTLRQVDGAKNYWAFEHGYTNVSDMHREVTQQDIAQYVKHGNVDKFGFGFDQNGYIQAGSGIIYSINPVGASPEAKFTSDFRESRWPRGWKIPKGTVMIFVGINEKYILPGHESQSPKSIEQVLPRP